MAVLAVATGSVLVAGGGEAVCGQHPFRVGYPVLPPANRGRFYVQAMQRLADSYADLLTPPVRHSVLVGSAYADGTPLTEYAPTAPVTEDYRAVLAYLQVQGVL